MNRDERNALVLGALLHDVGKFEYRAKKSYTPHAQYSEYFVNEHLGKFQCLGSIREQIRRHVSYHHYAELASASLQEGDHIAAAEREEDESRQTRRPLISILSQIDIGKGKKPDGVFYYPPGAVNASNPFPEFLDETTVKEWKPDQKEVIDLHSKAWERFIEDIRKMPDGNAEALIDTLIAVMEKHLSRVVSAAYKSLPDISLFDHSRMVAAIAVCVEDAEDKGKPFLAIQGDISGIQRFIYKLASPDATKKTAKRLRGRSFFISLLSETVATLFLRKLGLYRTNLVFGGGGHFLILAPNTGENRRISAELEQELSRWLHQEMRGDLGLLIASIESARDEIRDFSSILERIGYEMAQIKRRKLRSILDEEFFKPFGYDHTMDVCAVCQQDFKKGSGDGNICDRCVAHVAMGKKLIQAEYLVQIIGQGIQVEGFDERLSQFDIYYGLLENRDEVRILLNSLRGQKVEFISVQRMNNTDFLDHSLVQQSEHLDLPTSWGFRFVGNHAPTENGGPLEFEELAKIDSDKYPLLGIVRMDVDSLGSIFSTGLSKENRSPSRLASLSREMSLFFLGYVNHLAQKHQMYITYSGGDDLFAVGSWKKSIDFAREVREEFDRFACKNPNVTLSGGLLFCKPDFPIGRAAEACKEEEDGAKREFEKKDAVAIFGKVVHWDRLKVLMDFADELLVLLGDQEEKVRLPRSFVHRLLQMGPAPVEERGEAKPEAKTRRMKRNLTRLHYLVARHGATYQAIKENAEINKPNLKIALMARLLNEPDLLENMVIPASFVLYRTREKEKKNG